MLERTLHDLQSPSGAEQFRRIGGNRTRRHDSQPWLVIDSQADLVDPPATDEHVGEAWLAGMLEVFVQPWIAQVSVDDQNSRARLRHDSGQFRHRSALAFPGVRTRDEERTHGIVETDELQCRAQRSIRLIGCQARGHRRRQPLRLASQPPPARPRPRRAADARNDPENREARSYREEILTLLDPVVEELEEERKPKSENQPEEQAE